MNKEELGKEGDKTPVAGKPSPLRGRPWLSSYAKGVPHEIHVPDESLPQMLHASVRRFGKRPALDFFGEVTTYRELGRQVRRGAAALKQLGVKRGDRVALVLPNCPQHVVAFYAALRLGAVVVEHNPQYPPDELANQLGDCGARVAICWDKIAGLVSSLRERTPLETVIAVDMTAALPLKKRLALLLPLPKARKTRAAMTGIIPPGTPRWEKLIRKAPHLPDSEPMPRADDVALIQYTGGTTGTPKGAILTHRNLRANAIQGRAWVPGFRDGKETIFAVLPLFHAYGLTLCLTFALSSGARLVLLPRFDVDMMLDEIRRQPPTFLPAVPPIYKRLAEVASKRGISLRSIRFSISGAMPLPPAVVEQWEAVSGGYLVEGYGLTETSPVALGNPIASTRRPGTVGVPFPSTEIRIVDPDEPTRDMPLGQSGELLLRGPQVFTGYWNRPKEETEQTLLPGGWLRTGDVAVADEDGFVRIVDRLKELVITGGFNVYPSQVEAVLEQAPAVGEVAVVGLPNADFGEEVVAAVVPSPGQTVDVEAVRAYAREHLASYHVPRRVYVVDDLPRSLIGKVLRREVRDGIVANLH